MQAWTGKGEISLEVKPQMTKLTGFTSHFISFLFIKRKERKKQSEMTWKHNFCFRLTTALCLTLADLGWELFWGWLLLFCCFFPHPALRAAPRWVHGPVPTAPMRKQLKGVARTSLGVNTTARNRIRVRIMPLPDLQLLHCDLLERAGNARAGEKQALGSWRNRY